MATQTDHPDAAFGIVDLHFGDAGSGSGSGRNDERDRRVGHRSDRGGDPRRDRERHEHRERPETIREDRRLWAV